MMLSSAGVIFLVGTEDKKKMLLGLYFLQFHVERIDVFLCHFIGCSILSGGQWIIENVGHKKSFRLAHCKARL